MADEGELAQFVREHTPSVWAVELLLLLKRDVARAWPAAALTAELRASAGLVDDILERFERSGLAIREAAGWRYAPASPQFTGLVRQLEQAWRERPVAIVNLTAGRG